MTGMPERSANNFIILIDALRHDYVSEQDSPFLHQLKTSGVSAEVVETFAFQTRPAYFAGLNPDQSNICNLFRYDPARSPFSWLRPFTGILQNLDPRGDLRTGRGIIKRFSRMREYAAGFEASARVLSTEAIPLWLLPYFAPAEREYTDKADVFSPFMTIFDLMRNNNMSWAWIGYPRHFGSTESILAEYQKLSASVDFAYLHFSELDWIGHRHGPDSKERIKAFRNLDRILEELLDPALQAGAKVAIFGDHGMVAVRSQLDLWAKLHSLDLKLARDYLVFLDSTQARFWYFNPLAKRVIEDMLSELPEGHILQEHERKELGLCFSGRDYGDSIFVLDLPAIIHPSFFSRAAVGPTGMHGYLPHLRENNTQLILAGSGIEADQLGLIHMTDIFEQLKRLIQ